MTKNFLYNYLLADESQVGRIEKLEKRSIQNLSATVKRIMEDSYEFVENEQFPLSDYFMYADIDPVSGTLIEDSSRTRIAATSYMACKTGTLFHIAEGCKAILYFYDINDESQLILSKEITGEGSYVIDKPYNVRYVIQSVPLGVIDLSSENRYMRITGYVSRIFNNKKAIQLNSEEIEKINIDLESVMNELYSDALNDYGVDSLWIYGDIDIYDGNYIYVGSRKKALRMSVLVPFPTGTLFKVKEGYTLNVFFYSASGNEFVRYITLSAGDSYVISEPGYTFNLVLQKTDSSNFSIDDFDVSMSFSARSNRFDKIESKLRESEMLDLEADEKQDAIVFKYEGWYT